MGVEVIDALVIALSVAIFVAFVLVARELLRMFDPHEIDKQIEIETRPKEDES